MSYAAHSKDINRHKSWHPSTYKAHLMAEQAEQRQTESRKEEEARKVEVQRLQLQEEYESLLTGDAAEQAKYQRIMKMLPGVSETLGATASGVGAETEEKETKKEPIAAAEGKTKTGRISAEEAARLKKQVDGERKAKRDPLAKVQAFESAYVGEVVSAMEKQHKKRPRDDDFVGPEAPRGVSDAQRSKEGPVEGATSAAKEKLKSFFGGLKTKF